MTAASTVGDQVVITHPIGLHARPAVKLTKLAKTFDAVVSLSCDKGASWVDAKSIVRVMALKVKVGETLCFRAAGPEAQSAIEALTALVQSDFNETDIKKG